jgi:hypothetical protein
VHGKFPRWKPESLQKSLIINMSQFQKFNESLHRVASHSLLQAGLLAAGIGLAIGLAV